MREIDFFRHPEEYYIEAARNAAAAPRLEAQPDVDALVREREAWALESGLHGWDIPGAPERGRFHGAAGASVRSDERLRQLVMKRLEAEEDLDLSNLEVEILDGEAILKGCVSDRLTRYRIEDTVDLILGVREVDNRLKIREH